ncbi:hypothetical protein PIB30_064826 [Stylosanthes scabra]|uniref:Uncharacterized protein n=1 Tax=Stylosanthes scabra TaxID=79078 RepID=A0ABU6YPF6_9FABA|nr:hypothetical protein [Stylosanthes scabra]
MVVAMEEDEKKQQVRVMVTLAKFLEESLTSNREEVHTLNNFTTTSFTPPSPISAMAYLRPLIPPTRKDANK